MNRIQAFAPAAEVGSSGSVPASKVGASAFSPARGIHPHAFFAPLHYESNYAYPLLVWLHGSGDDESQLKRIMPLVSLRNSATWTSSGRSSGFIDATSRSSCSRTCSAAGTYASSAAQ